MFRIRDPIIKLKMSALISGMAGLWSHRMVMKYQVKCQLLIYALDGIMTT
jgi:hypothetical protein